MSFVVGLCTLLIVATSVSGAEQGKPAPSKASAPAVSAPVNINTATVAQLEALPGVGAKTAQLIVEHRQKVGGFKKVEELMNIKGIGEKAFLKLKPMITLGAEKTERQDR
jgi:competence protein ComEA